MMTNDNDGKTKLCRAPDIFHMAAVCNLISSWSLQKGSVGGGLLESAKSFSRSAVRGVGS